MKAYSRAAMLATFSLLATAGIARADGASVDGQGDPKSVSSEDGKYVDGSGTPTYNVEPGGKVDYYTFAGFVRYGANCLACHGPDGLGSTYAPSLVEAFKHLDYATFLGTVAAGKKQVSASQQLVMPTLGENKNVMCYIDAIYVYLRARSNGAVGRGRPAEHDPKPAAFSEAENQCMG